MPWWGWIILSAILLSSELFMSTDFYLVFFGVGALVLGLLGLQMDLPVWGQWLLFSGISVFSLVVFRGRLKRRITRSHVDLPEPLIGDEVVATEAVDAGGVGAGELRGASWKILNTGAETIAPGDRCVIERVEGLSLYVKRRS